MPRCKISLFFFFLHGVHVLGFGVLLLGLEISQPLSIQIKLCPILSLLLSGISVTCITVSHISLCLFFSVFHHFFFPSSCNSLSFFYCLFILLILFLMCQVCLKPTYWILNFNYCIFFNSRSSICPFLYYCYSQSLVRFWFLPCIFFNILIIVILKSSEGLFLLPIFFSLHPVALCAW